MPEIADNIKSKLSNLRIALVHDYLVQDGGAERVFAAFNKIFPESDTHVLLHNPKKSHKEFADKKIHTSFLQKWPLAKRYYEWYLPLMPLAVEHLDFSDYDLALSSSSSFAKGIIVPAHAKHVCYLHTPTRFLWENRINYLADLPHPAFVRAGLPWLLHRMRGWDKQASERADSMLTNSQTSRRRIKRYYNRDAQVIHPPVDTEHIHLSRHDGEYWLAGGRLVPYKRFDLVVKAFAKLNVPLIIFGTGPELKKLKRLAGHRTKFVGAVSDLEKIRLYRRAIGFINPQVEDFGITAVEAMSAGRPVIAYGIGGAAETVLPDKTGKFIDYQTWEDIGDAVIRHNPADYDPKAIREFAESFSHANFEKKILQAIASTLRLEDPIEEELALIEDTYAPYLN
ncbi:glycosyltransferase [Candidatus Uhrbacteria bacterium]|nr:glycosyltransferase [Candidatus Uhrbacteria bacterium]